MEARVLEAWQWRADGAARTYIAPDGCRDVLVRRLPSGGPLWMAAPRVGRAYAVEADPGTRFQGIRFEPGAQFDAVCFEAHMRQIGGESMEDALDWVRHEVRCDPRVREALQALESAASVLAAAQSLGLSARSLRRLFAQADLPAPLQWRRLARLRRCAQAWLVGERRSGGRPSLVELAADFGFADQAHLNREFQAWLGTTPRRLLAEAAAWQGLLASGYGTA